MGNDRRTNSREHELLELQMRVKTLEAENATAVEMSVELEESKQRFLCVSSELAQRQAELESQQQLVDYLERV